MFLKIVILHLIFTSFGPVKSGDDENKLEMIKEFYHKNMQDAYLMKSKPYELRLKCFLFYVMNQIMLQLLEFGCLKVVKVKKGVHLEIQYSSSFEQAVMSSKLNDMLFVNNLINSSLGITNFGLRSQGHKLDVSFNGDGDVTIKSGLLYDLFNFNPQVTVKSWVETKVFIRPYYFLLFDELAEPHTRVKSRASKMKLKLKKSVSL
ncbi:hypothetical protein A3Q56_05527 [Intoshia linei]|uniref:Lipid-binding serum glycoprotein N-terminal domain-containing protein n=1 Tax=Intoshia linei TaxID=1819745 RepID=A0A177AXJ2_9BILA|nr:hypothetical protein A3Q56_05527 [Intoshia linei]